MTTQQFQVRRDHLATTRTVTLPDEPLPPGAVRVRIERVAFTANNITYAAFGEAMGYWRFYPAGGEDAAAWGVIPLWGFATVVQSDHPGVAVGERLYGFWPAATHAVLQPTRLSATGFTDGAPHRAELHALYNQVLRCAADPLHDPAQEDMLALLRPLFLTAWLIDDFLADNAFFGATTVLLSSASSKTALATAALLAARPGVTVVGLTAAERVGACEALGVYHRVLPYGELDALPADTPLVYVDFAGNAGLRRALHERFSALAYSCSVGGTHVEDLGGARDLPGPRPVLFFAPAQAKKRVADWGAEGFLDRQRAAWRAHVDRVTGATPPWLEARHHRGAEALAAAYAAVLAGRDDPRTGRIVLP